MVTPNGFRPSDTSPLLPPWLSISSNRPSPLARPPSPSVDLTLSPSAVPSQIPVPWQLQPERLYSENNSSGNLVMGVPTHLVPPVDGPMSSELAEYFQELDEQYKVWMAHKKETEWKLRRLELQLESDKACKRREKMVEIESKVRALREEQKSALERIEAEYREQILGLRRDAEAKEQKLVEQWAAKHLRLAKFLEQIGYGWCSASEPPGRGGRNGDNGRCDW